MGFGEGVEKAGDYAKQAIELMNSHDVPAAPPNYAVWYSYVSERFPDLKSELDQIIKGEQSFDGSRNAALYETFIGHDRESALIQQTGDLVNAQVQELLRALGDASGDISGFGDAVKSSLKTFTEDKTTGGIETFVQSMILETRRIQETNTELQEQLNLSAEKISALQQNLEKAEEESYTDALTGIANRKKLDATLVTAMAEAEKSGSSLCFAVGDIDKFKLFNDTYGHTVGDQVLKLVARALHDNVKGNDLAARYGGEEFALVLPNTNMENAFSLLETIRKAIGSRRIRNTKKGVDFGSVTLSLGLAKYQPGEAASTLIERADIALYSAKAGGRNCTVCEGDTTKT